MDWGTRNVSMEGGVIPDEYAVVRSIDKVIL